MAPVIDFDALRYQIARSGWKYGAVQAAFAVLTMFETAETDVLAISGRTLSEAMGVSYSSGSRFLRFLKANGVIECVRPKSVFVKDGELLRSTSAVYRLRLPRNPE